MNQDLEKTLWAAADKLRSNMEAAKYKHVVLGLISLKNISDAFGERIGEGSCPFDRTPASRLDEKSHRGNAGFRMGDFPCHSNDEMGRSRPV